MKLKIGTRKSKLAMIQTGIVKSAIEKKFPDVEIEIVQMSTQGDRMLDRALDSFGGKGVFTQDLENALLSRKIDLAVHSAKDMPMELPKGLTLGAVLEREDPADVLVTLHGIPAAKLPPGSVIGTSSLRRELQIKRINPQVQIKMLRGNVPTRLEKLRSGNYDGILLAASGLKRLGLTNPEGVHLEYLDKETFLPAPGQGILAVEIRTGELGEIMQAIHDPEASMMLRAEREYLTILGGSCNAPCAAYCRRDEGTLTMSAMFAADGRHPVYRKASIPLEPGVQQDVCRQEADAVRHAVQLADKLAMQVQLKTVSLVGAGPGDAGLLTRKGLACIQQADVIVYDNLISASLLNEARLDAELIYVGKRSGAHYMSQEQMNELLVEQAKTGKYVVRLKGGDPFVFGRGGEEALVLKQNEIPYEIVPGVSSAYSVPAYAGIPVTDRSCASSFHVITGHEGSHKSESALNYEVLAKEEGTLVFLMGLSHLEKITGELIHYGKAAATPAAVIERGTTAGQKKVVAELGSIAAAARTRGIQTPAILVVGDTAALSEKLDWFGNGPLAGKRVLVTGTRYISDEIETELKPLGAETVAVSVIESRLMDDAQIDAAMEHIGTYTWMVFTSGNGVELFFQMLRKKRIDLRKLMHLKFAAIGRKTAAVLEEKGFLCDFVPESFSGEDLAKEWIPQLRADDRVLMLRAKEGTVVLPEKLKEAGIAFDDIPLYETWVDVRRREELNRIVHEVDYITLASGSAARALKGMLEHPETIEAKVIAIGPFTAQAAVQAGLKVHAIAAEYTAEGIAAVILADAAAQAAAGANITEQQDISKTRGESCGK